LLLLLVTLFLLLLHRNNIIQPDRLEAVRQKILVSELSSINDLETPDNGAYQAWQWIAMDDKAQLDVDDGGFDSRYILAIFYFSAAGIGKVRDVDKPVPEVLLTDPATNWMSPKSVCQWHGIECLPDSSTGKIQSEEHGSIVSMNLTDSGLIGTIPSVLLALSDLQVLILRMNELEGTIPSNILDMESLLVLTLNSNQLTGPVPFPKGSQSHLRQLNLGRNKLTGTIPAEISNASEMWALALNANQLMGPVPDLSAVTNMSKQFYPPISWRPVGKL
jgi:hypothetical protein